MTNKQELTSNLCPNLERISSLGVVHSLRCCQWKHNGGSSGFVSWHESGDIESDDKDDDKSSMSTSLSDFEG